ncbi:hypothetical protein [Vibrio sp. D431a]|uniref:hypothetical protein n=1 Tax=Vibrio sp. D431a TaxID=2837388 RepID=UPI0025524819|nr:hypothetical protein [Vibrio sp. D431a]MDK9793245.1 hypothetical protein [Vibrio sp. D431a]
MAPIVLDEGRVAGQSERLNGVFISCPYDYNSIQHNIWVAAFHDGYWDIKR